MSIFKSFNPVSNQKIQSSQNISEYKYNTETYMKEKMKIDNDYVDKIFSFYKKSITEYIMNTQEDNISSYRKKLISLIRNEVKINNNGIIYKDNTEKNDILYFSESVDGIIVFMILQYEEDSLIEKYDEKYNFDDFPIRELNKSIKNVNARKYSKFSDKYINEMFTSKNKNNTPNNVVIDIKECIFDYNHKEQKNYICMLEWDNKKIPVKLSFPLFDPSIDIIDKKLKSNNTKVKIIKPVPLKVFTTLKGIKIVKLQDTSWVFG